MRLLIVEDDVALRQSLAARLREADFTVDEAGTASEAEYFAAEFAVQLAIIDLGLPDRSGRGADQAPAGRAALVSRS